MLFLAYVSLGKVRFLKSATFFSAKVLASLVRAFSPGLFFLAKSFFRKVSFYDGLRQVLGSEFWQISFVFNGKVRLVKICGVCKIKSVKGVVLVFRRRVFYPQFLPTKRAPDAGDSAVVPSSFLRLSLFLAGRLRRPRPSAGNANRWHAPSSIESCK